MKCLEKQIMDLREFESPKNIKEAIDRIRQIRLELQNLRLNNRKEFDKRKGELLESYRKYVEWLDRLMDSNISSFTKLMIIREKRLFELIRKAYYL